MKTKRLVFVSAAFLVNTLIVFVSPVAFTTRATAQEAQVREAQNTNFRIAKSISRRAVRDGIDQVGSIVKSPGTKESRSTLANSDRFELFTGYQYLRASAEPVNNLNGWNVGFSIRAKSWVSLVAEVAGAYGILNKVDFRRHTLLFGPEFKVYSNPRVRIFLVVLGGLVRDSTTFYFGTLRTNSLGRACIWAFGGGLDVRLSERVSYRMIEYLPNLFREEWQNHGRITTGLIFHLGKKYKNKLT